MAECIGELEILVDRWNVGWNGIGMCVWVKDLLHFTNGLNGIPYTSDM